MNVHLWNKWNWLLLQLPVSSKELLDIQTTTKCTFTLKRGCDIIRKNSQLENFLLLYTVLLIYSKVKASQILHCGTTPVVPSKKNWIKAIYSADQKNISYFSYLFGGKKSQEKSCLPNCFTIIIPQVTEELLSPTKFVTKWTFIGYCKTSAIFWLIFSVSSPASLTTMRFP